MSTISLVILSICWPYFVDVLSCSDILWKPDATRQRQAEYSWRGVQHDCHGHVQHWIQDGGRPTSQVADLCWYRWGCLERHRHSLPTYELTIAWIWYFYRLPSDSCSRCVNVFCAVNSRRQCRTSGLRTSRNQFETDSVRTTTLRRHRNVYIYLSFAVVGTLELA